MASKPNKKNTINTASFDLSLHTRKGYKTEVVYRAISDLKEYDGNPRAHPEKQVLELAQSIARFGFYAPIILDEVGILIAGHGRFAASQFLKLEEVPTITIPNLSEEEKIALRIADNKIAENSKWSMDGLVSEMEKLRTKDFDMSLTGFDADEVSKLLRPIEDFTRFAVDPDDAPAVEENPVSALGDVWILGQHRVMCGSATEAMDVDCLMAGAQAAMCFTDPPYNVDYKGAAGKIKNDALGDGFGAFLLAACENIVKHTAGACYVAMSSSELHTLHSAFVSAGGKWSTFIIWVKNTFTLGRSDYQRGYEPILFGNTPTTAKEQDFASTEPAEGEVFKYRGEYQPILYGWPKDSSHAWEGGRSQSDVWKCDKPAKNPIHPTMKPVELVERAVRNSSKRGDIVLDLFGGSGSTLIAADKAGRRAYVMELDTRFVDVIIQRWQNFTCGKAINKDTGLSYDETRRSRKQTN